MQPLYYRGASQRYTLVGTAGFRCGDDKVTIVKRKKKTTVESLRGMLLHGSDSRRLRREK